MPFFVPQVQSENHALATLLRHQCAQLRTTVYHLSDEHMRLTPARSDLSIGGLLLHNAQVVHGWLTTAMRAPEPTPAEMYADISAQIGLQEKFSGAEVPDTMSRAAILKVYDRAVGFIDEAEHSVDLDVIIPGPYNPWMPDDMTISARWVWLHLITEVARHVGHADIIREQIDGKVSYELNFLVDGGTEQEWAAEVARFQQ